MVAARSGRREYQVLEEALRRYLGLEGLEAIWARGDLNEEEALALAYQEVLKLRPDDVDALLHLALVEKRQNHMPAAAASRPSNSILRSSALSAASVASTR